MSHHARHNYSSCLCQLKCVLFCLALLLVLRQCHVYLRLVLNLLRVTLNFRASSLHLPIAGMCQPHLVLCNAWDGTQVLLHAKPALTPDLELPGLVCSSLK